MRRRLFNGLGGSIQAYGAMKDDNLVLSAVAGSDSTSYSYACITVERLSAWCVCLEMWVRNGVKERVLEGTSMNGTGFQNNLEATFFRLEWSSLFL